MMSESEFGVRAVTSGGGNGGNNNGRSRSGSSASASIRPLPPMPATMKATSLENESDATSPTASSNSSSSHSFTALTNALQPLQQHQHHQQQPPQPFPGQSPLSPTTTGSSNATSSANSRLTPSQRSRSSPYVPSPLNPSMGPMASSPPSGSSTPPVSWRASLTPSSSMSGTPPIIAPVPVKTAPAAPPPGAALPRVSSSSAVSPNTSNNGGRGSTSLQKFASEEEELLNSGVQMPLKPRSRPPSSSGNRPASMVLYRLASDDDRTDPFNRPPSTMSLNPPNFRPGSISRFSTASQSPSVFSLSSDSKYPVFGSANPFDPPSAPFHQVGYDSSRSSSPGPSLHGQDRSSYYPGGAGTPPSPTTATQQGAFLPYEYDPAMDQDIVDDDDALHEPDPKGYKEGIGGVSGRGIANILCLIILVLGLLSLFVVGPVIDGVQREAFARAQNQPQIIAGPVGAANTADMLTDTTTSTDPFGGSLLPTSTTSRSATRTRTTATTTATNENGDPIDPATVNDGTTSTTRRNGAGAGGGAGGTGGLSTADDGTLARRTASPADSWDPAGAKGKIRGRGEWAGLRLPRQTAR